MSTLIEANYISPYLLNGPHQGVAPGQKIILPWQDELTTRASDNLPTVSRRRFLGTTAGVTIGLCLLTTTERPKPAFAQASSWPFQSNNEWFPLMGNQGLRLHDMNGPLDIYDQTYGTRVRSYFEEYANWALSESTEAKEIEQGKRPDTRRTWGFCSGAAVTNRELGRLRALGLSEEKITVIYKDPNKYGLLVAFHAGFAHFRPELYDIPYNNSYFIKQLKNNKNAFVGRINIGLSGDWYHVVHAVSEDETQLMVTGFGKNNIWISSVGLEFSYLPESIDEAKAQGRSAYFLNENKRFRTDELTQQRAYEFAQII